MSAEDLGRGKSWPALAQPLSELRWGESAGAGWHWAGAMFAARVLSRQGWGKRRRKERARRGAARGGEGWRKSCWAWCGRNHSGSAGERGGGERSGSGQELLARRRGVGGEKRRASEPFSVCVYVTMGADRAGRNQCLGQGDDSCGTNHSKLGRHCSLMFWLFFFLCKGFSSWEAVRDRVGTALCISFQAFISIVFLERVRLDDVRGKD